MASKEAKQKSKNISFKKKSKTSAYVREIPEHAHFFIQLKLLLLDTVLQ